MPLPPKRKPIKTISLFTGAGGLDIGFHAAGFEILACVEIERHYCNTLEANKGKGCTFGSDTEILREDVRRFKASDYAGFGVECIIGGPPCQTFSAAGRRSGGVLGTSDARGRLFNAYCDILDAIKPRVFVFENVYGLPGANNGGPWREMTEAFSARGYTLKADVLDAADYGVPQHRERLIMVGFRKGDFQFPATHGPDSPTGQGLISVGDALADLQNVSECEHDNLGGALRASFALSAARAQLLILHARNGTPRANLCVASKFHDFLYKVDPEYPCRTIKARPGKFTGPFHWKNRHFTVEELKRLQSFPDDYIITGNYGRVVEQIGNSVPPLLAEVIATSVREQLMDKAGKLTHPCRGVEYIATFRQRQRDRTKHFHAIASRVIAQRYAPIKTASTKRAPQKALSYYATYEGFFGRKLLDRKPPKDAAEHAFKVSVMHDAADVELTIDNLYGGKGRKRVKIEIGGLHEGLTDMRTITANANIHDMHDIFFVWAAIEEILVRSSKFLTLINVYGHYANRGDTVKIRTDVIGGAATILTRAIRFFGDSVNCGEDVSRAVIRSTLNISDNQLDQLITDMRSMRFDIRTKKTHPTMARGMVLCTYPFPLLSSKAHLERRLKPEPAFQSNDD